MEELECWNWCRRYKKSGVNIMTKSWIQLIRLPKRSKRYQLMYPGKKLMKLHLRPLIYSFLKVLMKTTADSVLPQSFHPPTAFIFCSVTGDVSIIKGH